MTTLEELDHLKALIPEALRVALKDCEALDTFAARSRGEALAHLNDLVPQALGIALQNCETLDSFATRARGLAFRARVRVCKDCPHPPQFIASYYKSAHIEGRVCRLCGLQESRENTGYKSLTTIGYSDDHHPDHRVEFNVAMSYRRLNARDIRG